MVVYRTGTSALEYGSAKVYHEYVISHVSSDEVNKTITINFKLYMVATEKGLGPTYFYLSGGGNDAYDDQWDIFESNLQTALPTLEKQLVLDKNYVFKVSLDSCLPYFDVNEAWLQSSFFPSVWDSANNCWKNAGKTNKGIDMILRMNPQQPEHFYTVVYDANGGKGAPESNQIAYDPLYIEDYGPYYINPIIPTRTGYSFKEWNTKSNGTGQSFIGGPRYTDFQDLTLYAIWEKVLNTEDLNCQLSPAYSYNNQQFNFNIDIQVEEKEYYTDTREKVIIVKAISSCNDFPTGESFNPEVAKLRVKVNNSIVTTYQVTVNKSPITFMNHMMTIPIQDNGITTLTFDCIDCAVPDSASVILTQEEPLNTYTLSYNANGGVGSLGSQTHNGTVTLHSMTPSREGYRFVSWNSAADGTGVSYQPGATISVLKSITLYAIWEVYTGPSISAGDEYLSLPTFNLCSVDEITSLDSTTKAIVEKGGDLFRFNLSNIGGEGASFQNAYSLAEHGDGWESSAEVAIGTWIDGKTIYRKAWKLTVDEQVKIYEVGFDRSKVDVAIKMDLTCTCSAGLTPLYYDAANNNFGEDYMRAYFKGSGGILKLHGGTSNPPTPYTAIVVLEYTKPTGAATGAPIVGGN